jgi:hypothetical protein
MPDKRKMLKVGMIVDFEVSHWDGSTSSTSYARGTIIAVNGKADTYTVDTGEGEAYVPAEDITAVNYLPVRRVWESVPRPRMTRIDALLLNLRDAEKQLRIAQDRVDGINSRLRSARDDRQWTDAIVCSGCGHPMRSELEFSLHYDITNRMYPNLGECPVKVARKHAEQH